MNSTAEGADFKTIWQNNPEIFVLYRYQPSLSLAIIAFICFLFSTTIHVVQACKYRTFYFIPLLVGGCFEWTGYIGRICAHYDQYALGIYVWQTLVLLLGPTLFAATIYMTLSAIIQATHGESCSPIRSTWLTKIFICGDLLAFLIQGGGMPPIVTCLSQYLDMMNNRGPPAKASTIDAGRNIVVSGLILQITFFSVFILTTGLFHYHISHPLRPHPPPFPSSTSSGWWSNSPRPSTSPIPETHSIPPFPYQGYLFTLYFASVLVLTRSLFRVAEFMGGHAGELMAVEWYLYVFDAILMLGVMGSLNVFHPGRIGGRELLRQGQMIQLGDKSSEWNGELKELSELDQVVKMESREAGRVGRMA